MASLIRSRWQLMALTAVCLLTLGMTDRATGGSLATQVIMVPGQARFTPFVVTVRVGQAVEWINNDTEEHYLVSDNAFITTNHKGVNTILGPNGGTLTLTFSKVGVFTYYCSLHATLDQYNQPTAPGSDGGIQGTNGNYGTPMSGVVVVQ